MVEKLYSHGKISQAAKQYALSIIYPHHQWVKWMSNLLLATGLMLVLSGIVFFYAFNWATISPAVKMASIQIGMISCLIGAYFSNNILGQMLLLAGSVLVGVFMAVFGQIYQTGADAFQLFLVWSLLILGWTLLSNFASQWLLSLAITNIAIFLSWEQLLAESSEIYEMIFIFIALLNGSALLLREYFVAKKKIQMA